MPFRSSVTSKVVRRDLPILHSIRPGVYPASNFAAVTFVGTSARREPCGTALRFLMGQGIVCRIDTGCQQRTLERSVLLLAFAVVLATSLLVAGCGDAG